MNNKKYKRREKLKQLQKSFLKFKKDVKKKNPEANFKGIALYQFKQASNLNQKPAYSELIQTLLNYKGFFDDTYDDFDNNVIIIPKSFSFIENHTETSIFIKKMFNTLYNQTYKEIIFDYKECEYIDICASMVMDIILSEFIDYFKRSNKEGHRVKIEKISPINIDKYEVKKIIYSIGAFKNLKGFELKFDNLYPFPILIGNKDNQKLDEIREVHITNTVDYIIDSLSKVNRRLTNEAESNFYKVIGEVMQNAEEHSSTKTRYCIGYFEMVNSSEDNYGIFNLAILNFGNSFYDSFVKTDNPNLEAIEQMKDLSKKYTTSNWFRRKSFEEETLWTLYILQDGVTRFNNWDRGNGTMRFIENFLNLKGDDNDLSSKMVLTTGHTKIIFDGTYKTVEKLRSNQEPYKMITFNDSGNIESKPDNNYVMYEECLFPGSLLSVKLKLDFENTTNI